MISNLKVSLTIRQAKGLPKIGLSSNPSPYIIAQLGSHQSITGICKNTCNPFWSYTTQITAHSPLDVVTFYVYNSNPNHIDQLIAFGQNEFENFMTRVVTRSKIMLKDVSGNYLRSYLEFEHYDCNPPQVHAYKTQIQRIQYSRRTAIRINLLRLSTRTEESEKWLKSFKSKSIRVNYANQSKELNEKWSEETLMYSETEPSISMQLVLDNTQIESSLLIANINKYATVNLQFQYKNYEVVVLLCVSMIPNGFLPPEQNILCLQIDSLEIIPQARKPKDWSVAVYSVFGVNNIKKTKVPISCYILNNTSIRIEYLEDTEESNVLDMEPLNVHTFSINSINWSGNFQAEESVKLYNQMKGMTIAMKFKLSLMQSKPERNMIPNFMKPNFAIEQGQQSIRVNWIKMSGACFSQIFTEKTNFYFLVQTATGVMELVPFQLRNSTEYTIASNLKLKKDQQGVLYFVTPDHLFSNENEANRTLENHFIFKILFKDFTRISDEKILFNEKFLSFAKKITVVKVCKKFDQMIKDRTLTVSANCKSLPYFMPGNLTIHNCILEGLKNRVILTIIFDSNELILEGQTGKYMLEKPLTVKLKQNGVQIKIEYGGNTKSMYSDFEDLFGVPESKNLYKISFPVGLQDKLHLIYSFVREETKSEKKGKIDPAIEPFDEDTPIQLKVKSAIINHENYHNFVLRLTKGSTTYETLDYSPVGNYIRFRKSEKMLFGTQAKDRYVFASLYCQNSEGGLVIYSGHLDVRNILGKGSYQILLSQMGSQNNKTAMIILEILDNRPLSCPALKMSLKKLSFSTPSLIKSVMKYYLVAQVNSNPIGIFQVKRNNSQMIIEDTIQVKNGDNISWKLYCSVKNISQEIFWSTEKQLMASSQQYWTQIQLAGTHELRFIPTRDIKSKFSSCKLALLESSIKMALQYTCEPILQARVEVLKKKPKYFDIQVLHSAAAIINIVEIIPHFSLGKTLQFVLEPFHYNFCTFSRLSVDKQFLVNLQNMKMKCSVSRSLKLNEKYVKQISETEINFRERNLKTEQNLGVNINFPGICLVKSNVTIISNKFTNNPQGVLKLLNFQCKGLGVKEVEIYKVNNVSQIQGVDKIEPFRFHLAGKQSINIDKQFQTLQIGTCLYFIITFENKAKVKSLIEIAKINIDKIDEKPLKYQWIEETNKPLLFSIEISYSANIVKGVENQVVKYQIQNGDKPALFEMTYHNKNDVNLIHKAKQLQTMKIDRKRGFKIIIQIPHQLLVSSVSIVMEKDAVQLTNDRNNSQFYTLITDKELKIQKIAIQSPINLQIEQLEAKNFTRRFLLNRNPKLMTFLTEQPYAIADIPSQSMLVCFTLHRLVSNQGLIRKLMWMQNNKYDEILTRKFGLLLKHGDQFRIIRPIEQNGEVISKQFNERTVKFGFQAQVDELEIYLYIHHVLNEKQEDETIEINGFKNWMHFLPVAYGKLNLQKIQNQALVGCNLTKVKNRNQTLDYALNQVIVRSQAITCLGSVFMQKSRWGYEILKLIQVSPIELEGGTDNQMVYIEFSIESTQKRILISKTTNTTEARQMKKGSLVFLNNSVSFFFIGDLLGETYSLKITANILSISNKYHLFEKRVDVTDLLGKKGNKPIIVQVKPNQTNGAAKIIQLNFQLFGSNKPIPKQNLVLKAQQINTVDIVSFQDSNELDMIQKLVGCQHCSHLHEIFQEVKQSVIYSKQSQPRIFEISGYYLQCQNDDKILMITLELMTLELHKFPTILNDQPKQFLSILYKNLKVIAQAKELSPQNMKTSKVTESQYEEKVHNLKADNMNEVISLQKRLLYGPMDQLRPSSLMHVDALLTLITSLCQKSSTFKEQMMNEIKDWNECFLYKQDKQYVSYLFLIQNLYKNHEMPDEIKKQILDQGFQRNVGELYNVEIWAKLSPADKIEYGNRLCLSLGGKIGDNKNNQGDIVKCYRTFINYCILEKVEIKDECWAVGINKCIQRFQYCEDIILLNGYGDLLIKLNSLGLVKEIQKNTAVGILKKRQSQTQDKNTKLILGNIFDKICGKDHSGKAANGTDKSKTNFYKKYLITS